MSPFEAATGSTSPPKDSRIVYGTRCTWWDDIHKTGRTGPFPVPSPSAARGTGARFGDGNMIQSPGFPCCPHCRGLLLEVPDMATWMKGVTDHEAKGHPGYAAFIEWQRGECFKTMREAATAYTKDTGKEVTL